MITVPPALHPSGRDKSQGPEAPGTSKVKPPVGPLDHLCSLILLATTGRWVPIKSVGPVVGSAHHALYKVAIQNSQPDLPGDLSRLLHDHKGPDPMKTKNNASCHMPLPGTAMWMQRVAGCPAAAAAS